MGEKSVTVLARRERSRDKNDETVDIINELSNT